MLFKKKIIKYISILVLVLFIGIPEHAFCTNSEKPSAWAEAEIGSAIENRLVPEILQGNYQSNIKRYQYVLLALEIYKAAEKTAVIKEETPFIDSIDHPYEEEIVIAYNAGIVKGDGKGNFHPDNDITREEIASLIVNLLKQISPNRDFSLRSSYNYNDRDKISDWATYYIDYCYENKILNGYSGNVMDPKGNATIEQSIALLYRLANSENLLKNPDIILKLSDGNTPEIKIVNQFAENYGIDTLNVIKELSNDQNIGIMSLWENSAVLSVNSNTISLNNPDFEKNIFALVHDANNPLFISAFSQLLETYTSNPKVHEAFSNNIDKMKANEEVDIYIEISNTEYLRIRSLELDGSRMSYKLYYIQNKE